MKIFFSSLIGIILSLPFVIYAEVPRPELPPIDSPLKNGENIIKQGGITPYGVSYARISIGSVNEKIYRISYLTEKGETVLDYSYFINVGSFPEGLSRLMYVLPNLDQILEEYSGWGKLTEKLTEYYNHPQKLKVTEKYGYKTGKKGVTIRSTTENNITTRVYSNMFDQVFLMEKEEEKGEEHIQSKYDASGNLFETAIRKKASDDSIVKNGKGEILEKRYVKEGHRFYEKYKDGKLWKKTDSYSVEGHQIEKVYVDGQLVHMEESSYDHGKSTRISYDPFHSEQPLYIDIQRSESELPEYVQEEEVFYIDGKEYMKIETTAEKLEKQGIERHSRPSRGGYFLRGKEVRKTLYEYEGKDTEDPVREVEVEGDKIVQTIQYSYENGVRTNALVSWDGKEFLGLNDEGKIKENITFSTRPPVLAVLDSGFDFNHQRIAPHYWKNSREILNGKDDDGNGFIDDILGLNVMKPSSLPTDDWTDSHGTAMMGICVTADCNHDYYFEHPELLEDLSVAGVKVFLEDEMPESDLFGDVLRYARIQGIKVLNMSFGLPLRAWVDSLGYIDDKMEGFWTGISNLEEGDFHQMEQSFRKVLSDPSISISNLKELVDVILKRVKPAHEMIVSGQDKMKAAQDEILIVAAAGNEHELNDIIDNPEIPQNSYGLDNVIIVAAATQDGSLSPYSNWSPKQVDVAAIGDELTLLEPQDRVTKSIVFGGTSAASAQVSKLAAVIYNLFLKNGFNINQIKPIVVKTLILRTVTPLDSLKGRVKTGGLINPRRAIEAVQKIVKELSPATPLTLEKIEPFLN